MGEDGFAVTLNFGDAPEPLFIPYDAIKTFVDPSVEFGLRFENQEEDDAAENAQAAAPEILPRATPTPSDVNDDAEKSDTKPADIVSLDSFRK